MKNIESVTALVNCLFSAYEKSIHGLDWEEKILEYSDVINNFIDIDTDLNALYQQIRENFANLPQPSAIKKMLAKQTRKAEIKEYVEHPDNGKKVVVVCYRNGIARELREYVICNTPETKDFKEITEKIKENFDDYKVFEFGKDTTIYHGCKRLEDDTIQATGEAWIPSGYNSNGEITGWDKRKIA